MYVHERQWSGHLHLCNQNTERNMAVIFSLLMGVNIHTKGKVASNHPTIVSIHRIDKAKTI